MAEFCVSLCANAKFNQLNNNYINQQAMKRTIIMFLAFSIMIPCITRSQNEGVKPVANPYAAQKSPLYDKTTREMAMQREQATSGGSPCPTGLPSENSSCYLEPGWTKGRVLLNDDKTLEDVILRYDIYHQQLQFIREEDTLAFAKPEEVKCFMLGERHFIYADYRTDDSIGHGYFEIASDGACRLLVRRTVKFHVDTESKPVLDDDVYIRECTYYISKNGEIARQVKLSRKSVLSTFADEEEQVRQYIDENEIKMNDCHQLKEVVDFYNSLN